MPKSIRSSIASQIAMMTVAVVVAALAGCAPVPPDGESTTLRWAYVLPLNSPFDRGVQQVKKLVEERTDRRVMIATFPGGQLGSDAETAEATIDGNIDITSGGIPYAKRPALQVHVSPFVFRDPDHVRRVLNGDLARKRLWDPAREALGVDFLDVWYFGAMYFFSNTKFTDAASANGVKIRVPEQQMAIDMIEAIGATPTPVAFPELYTALQTGTVDAMYGPLPNSFNAKLNEVTDYVVEFGYPSVVSTIVNARTFETLSAQDQKIVRDAIHEVGPWVTTETRREEATLLEQAREDMEVVPADTESFREAVQVNFVPGYSEIFGDGLYDALYNDQVEKK